MEQRGIYIRLIESGEVARVWIRLSLWYREFLKHMNAQRPGTLIVRLKTRGKAVASEAVAVSPCMSSPYGVISMA